MYDKNYLLKILAFKIAECNLVKERKKTAICILDTHSHFQSWNLLLLIIKEEVAIYAVCPFAFHCTDMPIKASTDKLEQKIYV